MSFPVELLRECWFLAGPTASGKSAAALSLAERMGAEILALDSMTLYRGMDIGTAKPDAQDRARVPHHLLDLIEPHEEFSLADYVVAAASAVQTVLNRRRVPLFVGGTGLYLRGLLRGVFEGPAADWDLRRRLEATAAHEGELALHQRLERVDPVLAARLPPADIRRVIRGLEVHELTGIPLSAQQQQGPRPAEDRPAAVVWLAPDRDWLAARIEARVDAMFAAGLVDEVRVITSSSAGFGRTASQGLGYREVLEHLAGTTTSEECRGQIKTRTRQFAKRQRTWFRNLEECQPLVLNGSESPEEVADRLLRLARSAHVPR